MQQSNDFLIPVNTRTFDEFVQRVDYSLMNVLHADPEATDDGQDHLPREVYSGHYVPVAPTPIPAPEYIAHSRSLFNDLGLSHKLADDKEFRRLFTGDLSMAKDPLRPFGWATGYALSIYGTEYTQQCPFGTGNGYGDGRAISVFEGCFHNKRWEMQLKGAGPTPYCRGADGRAVLRSSVREFLAQEFMHALGIPSSRSLTLYVSKSETVRRPWYSEGSTSIDPDVMVDNPVAISTRVASSFLRVGQIELFARRARDHTHSEAFKELEMIVSHLIERNYRQEIDRELAFNEQVIDLARLFRNRLISLVTHWLRVGYCQGNFNSDNCAAGGFTLDYGPFGFCELFNPRFQPWTGGGAHFSFFNQPAAAESNFQMFIAALRPLLINDSKALEKLDLLQNDFSEVMMENIDTMWAKKLGLKTIDSDLLNDLFHLMLITKVDYTIFFRELSDIPEKLTSLKRSFYQPSTELLDEKWQSWLRRWRDHLMMNGDLKTVSEVMKQTNPSVTWREWLIAPAYQMAEHGDYSRIHELQKVFSDPYSDLPFDLATKYDQVKPSTFFNTGGVSHYSCSS